MAKELLQLSSAELTGAVQRNETCSSLEFLSWLSENAGELDQTEGLSKLGGQIMAIREGFSMCV